MTPIAAAGDLALDLSRLLDRDRLALAAPVAAVVIELVTGVLGRELGALMDSAAAATIEWCLDPATGLGPCTGRLGRLLANEPNGVPMDGVNGAALGSKVAAAVVDVVLLSVYDSAPSPLIDPVGVGRVTRRGFVGAGLLARVLVGWVDDNLRPAEAEASMGGSSS